MITYRPIKDEEYLGFFNPAYQNSFFYNNMPDNIIIQDFQDVKKAFDAFAVFVVSKDNKDIGCFMLTYNDSRNISSVYSFVHPRSCKLGLISITTLAMIVLLHTANNTLMNFYFETSQSVIANVWKKVWPSLEILHINPMSFIATGSPISFDDEYLSKLTMHYPDYCLDAITDV